MMVPIRPPATARPIIRVLLPMDSSSERRRRARASKGSSEACLARRRSDISLSRAAASSSRSSPPLHSSLLSLYSLSEPEDEYPPPSSPCSSSCTSPLLPVTGAPELGPGPVTAAASFCPPKSCSSCWCCGTTGDSAAAKVGAVCSIPSGSSVDVGLAWCRFLRLLSLATVVIPRTLSTFVSLDMARHRPLSICTASEDLVLRAASAIAAHAA
mmetsp:Transcript_4074/g.11961  ORF Transcript_4074/g.11961 Transcript_4074/m.11961 type:complete len:213 (-) Transcript_4074:655-1293(-)